MLGARDGLLHALVALKVAIGQIEHRYEGTPPQHVRVLAQRERILRPLREVRDRLKKDHDETLAAYKKTCEKINEIHPAPVR